MTMQQTDICIVGGGLNGICLALALSNTGYSVALIEAFDLSKNSSPSFDDRGIALSLGSQKILQQLGVWSAIQPFAESIKQIHISDRGHFGSVRLNACEQQVAAFGYVISAKAMGQVLKQALEKRLAEPGNRLKLYNPARLKNFTDQAETVELNIEQQGQSSVLSCRLMIAADGADSAVRQQLDISVREWRYDQHAIIANVSPAIEHQQVAFERFTDSGPLALLPMVQEQGQVRCALVWTVWDKDKDEIMALNEQDFINRLQQRFGQRLGTFKYVGKRACHALRHLQVKQHYQQRCLLLGNAAHTLHPVAGQGLNLGLRDIADLTEILHLAFQQQQDPADAVVLKQYAQRRDKDQTQVSLATDVLARLFSNPLPPVQLARNIGLLGLNLLPGLRHRIAQNAMGLDRRMPRLHQQTGSQK